jgi:hypothetical protein
MKENLEYALRVIEKGVIENGDEFTAFTDSFINKDHYLVASDFKAFYE